MNASAPSYKKAVTGLLFLFTLPSNAPAGFAGANFQLAFNLNQSPKRNALHLHKSHKSSPEAASSHSDGWYTK